MNTETTQVGRPSIFTQELADRFCAELAQGRSMRSVCEDEGMPDRTTIFRWLRENEAFRHQYEVAKEESADCLAEDIIDIADDSLKDYEKRWHDGENGEGYHWWEFRNEHVQRSRLRVDARKWIASKLKPKKYGEKLDLSSGDKPIEGIKVLIVPPNPPPHGVDLQSNNSLPEELREHSQDNG